MVVWLTTHQQLQCEKLGECLWPEQKLTVVEIQPAAAARALLWTESKRGIVDSVQTSLLGA